MFFYYFCLIQSPLKKCTFHFDFWYISFCRLYIGDKSIIASLPTSKDYVPEELEIEHGCIECESKKVNCFVFSPSVEITECGKSFERPTYLYGYLLDEYEISKMKEIYTEKKDFEIWGIMKTEVFSKLIECFKSSGVVKRKYKRLL